MKISSFVVALLLIGLFTGVFGIYYAGLSSSYDRAYDNESFAEYESFDRIQAQAEEIDEKLGQIGSDTSAITTTTAYISSGYTVLKTTGQSFDTFNDMADEAIDQADLGKGTNYFKNYGVLIAFIIFIFIIVAVIIGREEV